MFTFKALKNFTIFNVTEHLQVRPTSRKIVIVQEDILIYFLNQRSPNWRPRAGSSTQNDIIRPATCCRNKI